MRRIAAILGLFGTALLIVFGILDHIVRFGSNFYFIVLMLCIFMMLPMLIKEALALRADYNEKNGSDKDQEK